MDGGGGGEADGGGDLPHGGRIAPCAEGRRDEIDDLLLSRGVVFGHPGLLSAHPTERMFDCQAQAIRAAGRPGPRRFARSRRGRRTAEEGVHYAAGRAWTCGAVRARRARAADARGAATPGRGGRRRGALAGASTPRAGSGAGTRGHRRQPSRPRRVAAGPRRVGQRHRVHDRGRHRQPGRSTGRQRARAGHPHRHPHLRAGVRAADRVAVPGLHRAECVAAGGARVRGLRAARRRRAAGGDRRTAVHGPLRRRGRARRGPATRAHRRGRHALGLPARRHGRPVPGRADQRGARGAAT